MDVKVTPYKLSWFHLVPFGINVRGLTVLQPILETQTFYNMFPETVLH